jgi:hypothetical protein
MELAVSGCLPLRDPPGARRSCRDAMAFAFARAAREPADLLLLSGRWSADDVAPLGATLGWLRSNGVRVALSGPIVEYDAPLPRLLALAIARGDPDLVARHRRAGAERVDRALAALAAAHGVPYLSPYRAMCPASGQCRTIGAGDSAMQQDYGHLTPAGSDALAAILLGEQPLAGLIARAGHRSGR